MSDSDLLRFTFPKKRWICFDFETNGLNLLYSLPFELSWAIYEGGKQISTHTHFIYWPKFSINPDVARLNHYDENKVRREGKPAKEVFDLFNKELYREDTFSVGANLLQFDIYIHNSTQNVIGYKTDYSYLARLYDTNSYSKAFRLQRQIDNENRVAFMFKMSSIVRKGLKTGVDAMCKEFSVENDPNRRHGAEYDNFLTMQIFQKLIWALEIK